MDYQPIEPHGHAIASDRYFSLMADDENAGYVHCGDGVLVVLLTEDRQVLLVQEWSPAFDHEVLTLVSGEIETGESLEQAANRELQEELGWRALRLDYIGELHPFKYLTTRQFVILARELVPGYLKGDETHPITARAVPLDEFVTWNLRGALHDALAIAAVYLTQHFLQEESK